MWLANPPLRSDHAKPVPLLRRIYPLEDSIGDAYDRAILGRKLYCQLQDTKPKQ
jgi:hypothetical protein